MRKFIIKRVEERFVEVTYELEVSEQLLANVAEEDLYDHLMWTCMNDHKEVVVRNRIGLGYDSSIFELKKVKDAYES